MCMLTINGCTMTRCTNHTYVNYITTSKQKSVVITTPDGEWSVPYIYVYYDPQAISDYDPTEIDIYAGYSNQEMNKANRYALSISVKPVCVFQGMNMALAGSSSTSTDATGTYTGSGAPDFKDSYTLENGRVVAGNMEVVTLNKNTFHVRINGLKVFWTGMKDFGNTRKQGPPVVWSVGSIDYSCKIKYQTLCQEP